MNKEKVIYFDDLKKLRKKAHIREWFQCRWNDTKNFVINNKETILFLAPTILGFATTTVKVVGKRVNLKKQKEVKDFYCYDRSLGHYWALRRELSNSEWREIDKRKRNGEKLSDILDELKVLK